MRKILVRHVEGTDNWQKKVVCCMSTQLSKIESNDGRL
jgi:hypothetical protein